jgi:hypothetical protein
MLTLNDPMIDALRRFDGWLDGEAQPISQTALPAASTDN